MGGVCVCSQFLEVKCRSSGEVRRFAFGTTARYALHAVNRKLAPGAPAALHVEAVKDGEEPVSFGPAAPLADYGDGWKLQTITEQDAPGYYQTPASDTVCKKFRKFFSSSFLLGNQEQNEQRFPL